MISAPQSSPRRLKAGAAIALAVGMLVGTVAPSAAATWTSSQETPSEAARAGFDRHFWRGLPPSYAPTRNAEVVALADEAEAMQAYCMDRFKSYDPATGTYLGYDGQKHPCP